MLQIHVGRASRLSKGSDALYWHHGGRWDWRVLGVGGISTGLGVVPWYQPGGGRRSFGAAHIGRSSSVGRQDFKPASWL